MQLIHGDCLEEMRKMPDKSVDLVLTDPPYGIDIAKTGFVGGDTKFAKAKNFTPQKWDIGKVDLAEVFRVSKNQIIFGGNYYNLPTTNSWIIWDKKCKNDWDDNFSDGELAWTSFKRPLKIFRQLSIGYHWNHKIDGRREHPTQKPKVVMGWIIDKYSKKGDTICDPFMGSGTTGVACKELGREFIGIEIDKGYYEIAKKRIANTQESLF